MGHHDVVNSLGFSKCGQYIFTAGKDKSARLYMIDKTLILQRNHNGNWL